MIFKVSSGFFLPVYLSTYLSLFTSDIAHVLDSYLGINSRFYYFWDKKQNKNKS